MNSNEQTLPDKLKFGKNKLIKEDIDVEKNRQKLKNLSDEIEQWIRDENNRNSTRIS